MCSTERKAFLQRRTSTAAERGAYRALRKAARKAYWNSPEGKAEQEKILQAHRDYLSNESSK